MKYPIPSKIFETHSAILGMNGSGKTVAAKGAVERILREHGRFGAIDPTGAWWGLKSSKDGKKAGFDVVIFGGEHADLPIGRNQGAVVADIVRTTNISFIIDTVLMTTGDRTRFMTDFFNGLMLKKGPLPLFIDEAHNFAPQGKVQDPEAGKMLSATNRVLAEGRSRGLRVCLLSQRPQKLHKDSLSEVRTLIVMQLTSPQNREAVESWIKENADKEQAQQILKSLAGLPRGTGWVWSPENDLLEKVHFPMISTYDSSRAPDEETGEVLLSKPDLSILNDRLATIEEEVKKNDPELLRRRIAELERAVKNTSTVDPKAIESARQAGYEEGYGVGIRTVAPLIEAVSKAHGTLGEVLSIKPPMSPARAPFKPVVVSKKSSIPKASNAPSDKTLPHGEKAILIALAQYPDGCTREQLTVLTGFKRSTRDAYIQRLRGKEYCEVSSDRVYATEQGVSALGDAYEPLPTGEALRDYWIEKLPEGESKILAELISAYPDALDRETLSNNTEFKRSTRDAYIQRLKAKQLISIEGRSEIKAAETLFEAA